MHLDWFNTVWPYLYLWLKRNEENAKRLAEKIAKKQEMAASGAVPAEKKKGHGGGAKKKWQLARTEHASSLLSQSTDLTIYWARCLFWRQMRVRALSSFFVCYVTFGCNWCGVESSLLVYYVIVELLVLYEYVMSKDWFFLIFYFTAKLSSTGTVPLVRAVCAVSQTTPAGFTSSRGVYKIYMCSMQYIHHDAQDILLTSILELVTVSTIHWPIQSLKMKVWRKINVRE